MGAEARLTSDDTTLYACGHIRDLITKFCRDSLILAKYKAGLQNSKWPPGGPKTADGLWKKVQPLLIGPSDQI